MLEWHQQERQWLMTAPDNFGNDFKGICVSPLLDHARRPLLRDDPGAPLTDAHLIERGLFQNISDAAGQFTGINPPWRSSGTKAEFGERVPAVEAQDILDKILPPSEQACMQTAGAVGVAKP